MYFRFISILRVIDGPVTNHHRACIGACRLSCGFMEVLIGDGFALPDHCGCWFSMFHVEHLAFHLRCINRKFWV